MRRRPRLSAGLALTGLALLIAGIWASVTSGGGVPPARPPVAAPPPPVGSGAVELGGWKLTIPVANAKGDASIVEPAQAVGPWMTRDPIGGLAFWAPTEGATTKHSEHPRTELDSVTNFTAGHGPHSLTASLTLTQTPQDGRGIILGQIHGAADISSVPYVMLRFQDGGVRVVVKQVQDGDGLINYPLLAKVELNRPWQFSITDVGDGTMSFTAAQDGHVSHVTAPVPAEFRNASVRFQAGDYQQANHSGGPQDGGRVIFHQLNKT